MANVARPNEWKYWLTGGVIATGVMLAFAIRRLLTSPPSWFGG